MYLESKLKQRSLAQRELISELLDSSSLLNFGRLIKWGIVTWIDRGFQDATWDWGAGAHGGVREVGGCFGVDEVQERLSWGRKGYSENGENGRPDVEAQVWKNQRGVVLWSAYHNIYNYIDDLAGREKISIDKVYFRADAEQCKTYWCLYKLMLLDDAADIKLRLLEQSATVVTPHYFPKVRESTPAKPHHVNAPSSSRNSQKESYGSNDMALNYYLEEAKKKTQDKNRNLKPKEMPSTETHHTPNACTPKPRSIIKHLRIGLSILTDSQVTPTNHGRMTKPYSSPRFIANYFNAGYLKMEVKVPDFSCLKDS
uniref:Uncharacterized protein n=1 Tax=Tanacetum cinerariifolium TaxID=118510 RepID=A0A6L2K7F6_TANCI|nr:hypothetical protein [Tanacetum cinerariifolium]